MWHCIVTIVPVSVPCEADPSKYVAQPPVPENPIAKQPEEEEAPQPQVLPEVEDNAEEQVKILTKLY